MNTNSEIRNRIKQMAIQPTFAAQTVSNNKPVDILPSMMGICIVLLSACICWVMWSKNVIKHQPSIPVTPVAEKSVESFDNEKWSKLTTWVAKTNNRLKATEDRIYNVDMRLWLMAIAHNENSFVNQDINKKQGIVNSNYIVFDKEWKINKMPSIVTLSAEEKLLLQKAIRQPVTPAK